MSARLLDGNAVAARSVSRCGPTSGPLRNVRAGPPDSASSWSATIRARRSTSATRCARHRVRAMGRSAAVAGDRDDRGAAGARAPPERQPRPRRPFSSRRRCLSDGAWRVATRVRRDRSRQGRRRVSSGQCRAARSGARASHAVYAVRRDRAARSLRDPDRGHARGDSRQERHRGKPWRCCCCSGTRQ